MRCVIIKSSMKFNKRGVRLKTAAIILAAGKNQRLGFPKQLVRLDGVSLVKKVALSLNDAGIERIGVVTGAWREQIEKDLYGMDVTLIPDQNWRRGLCSSISSGAAWLTEQGIEQSIFLATDQWKLSANDIIKLILECEKDPADVIAASYRGSWGMPLLINGSNMISSLISIDPKKSFVSYVEKIASEVVAIPMEHASKGLDTPAQIMELSEYFKVSALNTDTLNAIG